MIVRKSSTFPKWGFWTNVSHLEIKVADDVKKLEDIKIFEKALSARGEFVIELK